ncbi:hypothetical protein HDU96_001691 [Phlyctochytrium bullatum]|nr:hypothetical protein HDU96_001691 [Phlyctochytrium bullatum]
MLFLTSKKLAVVALAAASALIGVQAKCTNPSIRREWNELSDNDKREYIAAVKKLAARPESGSVTDPSKISLYDFVRVHTQDAWWAHQSAEFFVYHRAMLHVYEQALATVGYTKGLIYWDWSCVSQNWYESELFKWFGTQSPVDSANVPQCLKDGEFAKGKWSVATDELSLYYRNAPTSDTCLRRCGKPGKALTDAYTIKKIIETSTSYDAFRADDSMSYHGTGHTTVGGKGCDFGNSKVSPNDPIFFLHHVMVDKTWWRFQNQCSKLKLSYNGQMRDGAGVSTNDKIISWPYKVSDMLDTEGDVLCYRYSESKGDLPLAHNPACPKAEESTPKSSSSVVSSSSSAAPVASSASSSTAVVSSSAEAATGAASTTAVLPTTTKPFTSATATAPAYPDDTYFPATPVDPTLPYLDASGNLVYPGKCTLPLPQGYKLHLALVDRAIILPANLTLAPGAVPPVDAPQILRCPPPVDPSELVYSRPDGLSAAPAPGADPQAIGYPDPLDDAYIKEMGMDPYLVRKGEIRQMYAVDRCNADPECKSPSRLEAARDPKADLSFNSGLVVDGKVLGGDGKEVKYLVKNGKKCRPKKKKN